MDDIDSIRKEKAELERKLEMAEDAANKGDEARNNAGAFEAMVEELRSKLAEAEAYIGTLKAITVGQDKLLVQRQVKAEMMTTLSGDFEEQCKTLRAQLSESQAALAEKTKEAADWWSKCNTLTYQLYSVQLANRRLREALCKLADSVDDYMTGDHTFDASTTKAARQLERELTALKPTELTGRRYVENIESKPFSRSQENGPELPGDAKARIETIAFNNWKGVRDGEVNARVAIKEALTELHAQHQREIAAHDQMVADAARKAGACITALEAQVKVARGAIPLLWYISDKRAYIKRQENLHFTGMDIEDYDRWAESRAKYSLAELDRLDKEGRACKQSVTL